MGYWKDSLLTGVPQMDKEHRKLVEAIDKLMDACQQGKGRDIVGEILSFTVSYAKQHFKDEEQLQAKYSYPGMEAHKQIHAKFLDDVTVLVREFDQTGPSITLTGKLNKALVSWLISHISGEDRKLGEFIKKSAKI